MHDVGRAWPPEKLEPERLLLRPPVYDDAADLHALLNDPAVCFYLPHGPAQTLSATRHAVGWWASRSGQGLAMFAICLRSAPARAVGILQAQLSEAGAELGLVLAREVWGQGYGKEAFLALRASGPPPAYARFWGACDADNERATAMRAKLGLQPAAVLPGHRVHSRLSAAPRPCALYERTRPGVRDAEGGEGSERPDSERCHGRLVPAAGAMR